LKFLFQVGQQIGMRLSVDFLAENLLGTGNSELGDLITQGLLGTLSSDASFGFSGFTGLGNDTGGFGASFIDEYCCLLFSRGTNVRSGLARLAQLFDDFFLGMSEIALRLVRSRQPVSVFFARSSSAFTMGGQTNFIVTHARMKNTTSWATRVAFRFTVIFL